MKLLYFFLTIPFYILAKFFIFFNIQNLRTDLIKCRTHLKSINHILDDEILKILFLAEDHRVQSHYGIDQYAMLRAIYSTHLKKQFQGASTVAQQYVRVITNRYERTIIRKLREQLLAILITYEFNILTIGSAYLDIAFLGSGMMGFKGYLKWKRKDLDELDVRDKIRIVARLKYPEPLKDKENWCNKMNIREGNIYSKLFNN